MSHVDQQQPSDGDTMELSAIPAHGRDRARKPYAPLVRKLTLQSDSQPKWADQDFRLSIIDSLLTSFHKRPKLAPPDAFEIFLRKRQVVTIADLYHVSSSELACPLKNCFQFMTFEKRNDTISATNVEPTGNDTIADFFAVIQRNAVRAPSQSSALACLTYGDSGMAKIVSPGQLFTLSAYDEPRFWSRILLAYLLLWSEHVDEEIVDIIARADLACMAKEEQQIFCFPSQCKSKSTNPDLVFAWPSALPSFSALRSHAQRPYRLPVATEAIQLFVRTTPNGFLRLTLYFSSPSCLENFQNHFNSILAPTVQPSAHQHIVTFVILSICRQINVECLDRAEAAMKAANEVALRSRDHPGRTEYLYLTHLQDYISYAKEKIQESRDIIVGLESVPEQLQSTQQTHVEDVTYLLSALDKADTCLEESKQQVKALEELKQTQIAGIMSFLVAVYVPLAFVSSYFGMNTVDILGGDLQSSNFWQIAIPLTVVTIMLPLSLTIIARVTRGLSLSAAAFSYKRFETMVDWFIVAYIVAIIVAHFVHWRTGSDKEFVAFFYRISAHEPTIANAVFLLLCLLKTAEQSVLRNRRGRLWFFTWVLISSVVVSCFGISFVDGTSATLITPIVFFLLVIACRPLVF